MLSQQVWAAYCIELDDGEGGSIGYPLAATSDDEAVAMAKGGPGRELAREWCRGGDWGEDGAEVDVRWTVYRIAVDGQQDALDDGRFAIEIPPDHEALIRAAVGSGGSEEGFCGYDPDAHDWTSEGEGGLDENPGVWSTGGTSMTFQSHCRKCGLRRTEYHTGSQKNPGEHDTFEYSIADPGQLAAWRSEGHMDEE